MSKIKLSTFKKLFLSYFLICLIPVVLLSLVLYYTTTSTYKNDKIKTETYEGRIFVNTFENEMSRFSKIGMQLATTEWVKKRASGTDVFDAEYDYSRKKIICNDMLGYVATSNTIKSAAVMITNRNEVYSGNGFYKTDEFLRSLFYTDTSNVVDLDLLLEQIKTSNIGLVTGKSLGLMNANANKLFYIQPLELVSNTKPILFIEINLTATQNFLKSIKPKYITSIEVKGLDDQAFKFRFLEDEHAIKNEYQSSHFPYTYTTYHSNVSLTPQVNNYIIVIITILFTLLLSINVAFFLTKATYKPLKNIMNKLFGDEKSDKTKSDYQLIEQSIQSIVFEHKNAIDKAKQYTNAARSTTLINLLRGYFGDTDIAPTLEEFNLNYTQKMFYCVIVVEIQPKDKVEFMKLGEKVINNTIQAALSDLDGEFELIFPIPLQISIILSFSPEQKKSINVENLINTLHEFFLEQIQLSPKIVSGDMEKGLIGISKSSYIATEKLLASKKASQPSAVSVLSKNYYYPTEWVIDLINKLKASRKESALTIINEIRMENEKRQLSFDHAKQLCLGLAQTLSNLIDELNQPIECYKEYFTAIDLAQNSDELWQAIHLIVSQICQRSIPTDSSNTDTVANQIILYTMKNCTNPDLSLKDLGDKFCLTVSAISKIFKKANGINFYSYILTRRMEIAVELLEGKTEISKIPQMVGYENEYSFKRAFKRYFNCSVSEYIKKRNL
ncbi:MAG: helix-turn-helix transcriptional regulator [Oscillospiraceae bacterium]